jgi:hypothetical protein
MAAEEHAWKEMLNKRAADRVFCLWLTDLRVALSLALPFPFCCRPLSSPSLAATVAGGEGEGGANVYR